MDPTRVYFGHPVCFYNTKKEQFLLSCIERAFPGFDVENPNQPHHQEGYQRWKQWTGKGMDYYFREVLPTMSAGIFLPFADGMLGLGVWGEAEAIYNAGKTIWEISLEGKIKELTLDKSRMLSHEQTKARVYLPDGSIAKFKEE